MEHLVPVFVVMTLYVAGMIVTAIARMLILSRQNPMWRGGYLSQKQRAAEILVSALFWPIFVPVTVWDAVSRSVHRS